MRFRALLFDLDGTLVDSHREICLALARALRDLTIPLDFSRVESLVDGSPLEVIWQSIAAVGLAEARDFARFASAYRANYMRQLGHASALFPGVATSLTRIRARFPDLPLCIVSNKSEVSVTPLLKAFAIDHHFTLALGAGGTTIKPKPDPELLTRAATRLRCEISACAIVGDTVLDVLAGKNAGMTTIGVSYGMGSRAALEQAGADHLVDHFEHLEALLDVPS
jgi:HAD superfamily hydrolase (TIGR01509 family)